MVDTHLAQHEYPGLQRGHQEGPAIHSGLKTCQDLPCLFEVLRMLEP